ncbi:MAG: TonB-dependent receptor [Acidobacteria bacterium]|nr:TonB-dependent receptor [Acidobacteriota bacterium]
MTRTGCTVAFVCLLLAPLHAQLSTGELRLAVVDATGLAVPAAGTLASDASLTNRPFDTDQAGRVTFDRLPPGRYRLTVAGGGFTPHTELVDIRSALPREIRVTLELAPVAASVTVTDSATLVDVHRAGIAYTVGAQQVREQQSAVPGRELLDLVNLQPGWLMESNGVLHPRGSEYQTLFVVDGVPMDDNRSPAFAPELPDAEIEAVSVITGTFPAEYGRKLGGVVDVTTSRDPRTGPHGSVEAGGGSFGTGTAFASAGYGWGARSLTINAGVSRTDRYLDPPAAINTGNDGVLRSVAAAFDQQATPRDRIQVGWRASNAAFRVPNDLEQERAGQRQDRRGGEQSAQGAWTHVFSPRLLLSARAAAADLATDLWSNPASTPIVVAQQRGFRREYAKVALSAQAGVHEIKIGGDAVHAPVHEALQYRISDASAFSPGTASEFSFSDRQIDREYALFAQDTIRWGSVTASVGLRWDRYALVVHDAAVSPRVGVAWATPAPDLVLRFSYDRAFQTPAMENLLLASSPAVEPLNRRILRLPVPASRGDFVEGGFSAAVAKTARLDATIYRRGFSNFADDDVFLNTGISFPIAFRAAAIPGADLKLTLPRWRALSGFAGYSYLLGRAELPVTGGLFLGSEATTALAQTDRVPISQDQRHTARARVRYQAAARAWTAAVVRYGSGLPVELDEDVDLAGLAAHYGSAVVDRVDIDAGRLRPNVTIDWGGGVELWRRDKRRIELRAEIANVMNRLNVVNLAGLFSGTAVAPPRSANVRVRLEF